MHVANQFASPILKLGGAGGSGPVGGEAYTVPLGFLILATAASSTSYFSGVAAHSNAAASDTWAEGHYEIPIAGTIVAVSYSFKTTGAAAGETVTVALRLNDTTDFASNAEVRFDVAFETFTVTGLSQAVVAGDKIDFKMSTAGSFDPTNTAASAVVYFE